MTQWPNKKKREEFEIAGFIEAYYCLPGAVQFEVVRKSEMPDYIVKDVRTGHEYGVELTSVYLDDRSVPDSHMRDEPDPVWMPSDEAKLKRYRTRLVGAIRDKISKARKGYDRSRPLILAIYVNEYVSMDLPASEVQELVRQYDGLFEAMTPFNRIVFWNLPNRAVVCVKPTGNSV